MNEKKFYHTALEDELLSGKNLKAKLDAKTGSDRSAASVREQRTEPARSGRLQKWITVPAAAVLLLLTLALGGIVIMRGFKNTQRAGEQPIAENRTPDPIETLPVTPDPDGTPDPIVTLPVTPNPDGTPTPEPTPTPTPTELPGIMPRPTPTATPAPEYLPIIPENVWLDDDTLFMLYRTASDETTIEVTLDITLWDGATESENHAGVLAEQARLESLGYLLDVTAGSPTYRLTVTIGALRSFPVSLSCRYHFGLARIVPPAASVIPATEDTVDICIWFRDDFSDETALRELQQRDPELYKAYRNGGPEDLLLSAIERKREIAEAHYTAENRKKLASICEENAVLVLSHYAPMCIIRVQKDRVETIGNDPNVARIEPFMEQTATGS